MGTKLHHGEFEMSEKSFEIVEMSSVTEASVLVRRVAGPRDTGESVKVAIARAARMLGFDYSRTKSLWYRNARRIDAAEMDRLRDRAARQDRDRAVATMVELRSRLAATDAEFHRPTIAALDSALRGMGAEICAVAVRED